MDYTNAIEGFFNVLKSGLQKRKGLTYDELVSNVKDVLVEIPIHIYKNAIKGAYERSKKYVINFTHWVLKREKPPYLLT